MTENLTDVLNEFLKEDGLFIKEDATVQAFSNVISHARCLMDPVLPGKDGTDLYRMYAKVERKGGKLGLQTWRCFRGTSALESYHNQMGNFIANPWLNAEKADALIQLGNDEVNTAAAERFDICGPSYLPAPVLLKSNKSSNDFVRECQAFCMMSTAPQPVGLAQQEDSRPTTKPIFGYQYLVQTKHQKSIARARAAAASATAAAAAAASFSTSPKRARRTAPAAPPVPPAPPAPSATPHQYFQSLLLSSLPSAAAVATPPASGASSPSLEVFQAMMDVPSADESGFTGTLEF